MSSDPIISVRNLSKVFPIYARPADRLKQYIFPRLQRFFGLEPKQYYKTYSALSDINFEIQRGETVGIIGRNGAGKSTLLQIICGTLAPTSGQINVNGRIAALLELGAGFNGEYTGRENVYMNARILGLTEDEIEKRFDEIVSFAEIGEHLDQPVKTYSSGMFVRLAFSVIINVDADILIVDEALGVGDAFFQAKCMAKLQGLVDSGVTLLFVSHDIHAVKSLCDAGLYLKNGHLECNGDTQTVTEAYFRSGHEHVSIDNAPIELGKDSALSQTQILSADAKFLDRASFQRVSNGKVSLLDVYLLDDSGKRVESLEFGQVVELCYHFQVNERTDYLGAAYHIRNRSGFDVVYSDTGIERFELRDLPQKSRVVLKWKFKASLKEDRYTVAAMLSIPKDLGKGNVEVCDFVPLAAVFSVSKGETPPIYGAVHWPNSIEVDIHVLE